MPDAIETMNLDTLKTLNRRKGNLKARLTKLMSFLKESSSAADKYKMQSKLDNVKDIASELKQLKCCYYELVDDKQLEDIDSQFELLEEDLEDIKVGLQKFLFELDENKCSNLSSINRINNHSVKLPEVSLPEFFGNIENWQCFKVQFDSLITNNSSLTDSQKLFYLRSALKGEVVYIETPEDTFQSLMKVLIDRYENKRLIVNTHVLNILNIEKLTIESAKQLRNIVDVLNKNLRALKLLELEANELTQQFLMNIIAQKLDKDTRKMYEMSLASNEIPKWKHFLEFLEKRSQVLENLQGAALSSVKNKITQNKTRNFMIKSSRDLLYILCQKSHAIYRCPSFLKLNPLQRFDIVKKHKLCLNCLNDSHKLASCKSKYCCRLCNGNHNYLLCRNQNNNSSNEIDVNKGLVHNLHSTENSTFQAPPTANCVINEHSDETEPRIHALSSMQKSSKKSVLLSTAIVWVWSPLQNSYIQGRVILDCGSQCHLITSRFASELGLMKQKVNMPICGLSGNTTNVKWKVNSFICNANSSFSAFAELLVVEKIVDYVPSSAIDISLINIPNRSTLADPYFDRPGKIDMIIGAELFFQIIKDGKVRISNSLMFQNSVFGLIASGSVVSKNYNSFCGFISQTETLDNSLRKFWEMEEVSFDRPLSREAEFCELHFQKTHKRDDAGRFVVEMPIKQEKLNSLGGSRLLAEKRLQQTVKRLNKNPEMHRLYCEFLNEYESLNHMERITSEHSAMVEYFLPHHGVYKPEKTSTKLRVVFNASAPTTSSVSLNDILLTGEVKEDIFDIMIRFRKYKIVLTADIKQMFRQILVDPSQRNLLKILWKNEENQSSIAYRLNTVTYGTKCAPFLATRVIKQLALDESTKFPLASKVALSDIYMDDIVTGSQDVESARLLKSELISMFQTCCMTLHKWNSNWEELLENKKQALSSQSFAETSDATVKTLGMVWNSNEDKFVYKVSVKSQPNYTKREVLSTIAKLYDPFGLLGPVICKAKIFLQKLWLQKLDWDEILPQSIAAEWNNFVSSLPEIENITIDRFILIDEVKDIALFGFCDASLSAYGAVVYLICYSQSASYTSKLLASKSRVAPLKTLSIPRLELCSCVLLSKLVNKILVCLKMNIDKIVLYSDSTIALAWIRSPLHQLKTFVGNRVSKIQLLTENYQWKHITSANNPADILSRGIDPSQLKDFDLWWTGPILDDVMNAIAVEETQLDTLDKELYLLELKELSNVNLSLTSNVEFINLFLSLSNSYLKLIRILSFISKIL